MARIDNSQRGVLISVESARRIAKAVQAYEQGRQRIRAPRMRTVAGDDNPLRIGKTRDAWSKGTTATIDLYESGDPPDETLSGELAGCVNKFADIGADKWVAVQLAANGSFYLVSAECGDDSGSGS